MSDERIFDLAEHPIMTAKLPRFRTQSGVKIKLADGWYVRYWDWSSDGSEKALARERVRAFLAPLSITDEDELDRLQVAMMLEVNARQRCEFRPPDPKLMTVDQFFQTTFLPFIVQNRSRSTAKAYRNIWQMYCEDHFAKQPLISYRTSDGYKFFNDLASRQLTKVKGLSKQSLNLVRTVCSHLFKHAKNLGILSGENPIHDVEIAVKVRRTEKTVIYTPIEVAEVLLALPTTKAKLLWALCCLNGLRPAEAAALKWSDVQGDLLSIKRAAPDGVIGDTKTEKSVRIVSIVTTVAELLEEYRKEGTSEFLFPGRSTQCINAPEWAEYNIKRHVPKGVRYAGLYAGRRRTGSTGVNLVDSVGASGLLGNDKATTEQHYFSPYLAKIRDVTQAIQQEHEQALAAIENRVAESTS